MWKIKFWHFFQSGGENCPKLGSYMHDYSWIRWCIRYICTCTFYDCVHACKYRRAKFCCILFLENDFVLFVGIWLFMLSADNWHKVTELFNCALGRWHIMQDFCISFLQCQEQLHKWPNWLCDPVARHVHFYTSAGREMCACFSLHDVSIVLS